MPNERSTLEEEALKYHVAGQTALMEEAAKQQVQLSPLSTPEGRYQRGLVDENDEATDEGRLFVDLLDAGLYDDRGQLTQKGQAFSLDPLEALDEQNLPAYIIREKAGLNETPDITFGNALAGAGGFVWDAVKGAGRMIRNNPAFNIGALLPDSAEGKAEERLANQSFFEGAINAPAQLGAGLDRLNSKLWLDPEEDEHAYYLSKQQFEKKTQEINDLEAADYVAVLSETQGAVMDANRQKAIQQLGKDQSAEVIAEGQAAGNLFGDPSNYLSAGAGALMAGAEKAPILARMSAKVEQSAVAAKQAEQALFAASNARRLATSATRGVEYWSKKVDELSAAGMATRAADLRKDVDWMARTARHYSESAPKLEAAAQDAAAHAAKLAEASGGAQKVLATVEQMSEIGRKVRAAPARAMAPMLEAIGDGMIKADSVLGPQLAKFMKGRNTAAVLGVATGHPLLAVPAIAEKLLAAGPVVRGVGNFTRVLGDELMEARGTVPFWRRVAENSATTPLGRATAHAMDFATLGGKVPDVMARTARGIGAAAPIDIAFESVASGGDLSPNTLKQGLAESIIFGGGGALGGAVVKGNLADLRARAAGDELNFRRTLSPDQSKAFNQMPPGVRKSLSVYAATFPNLKFEMTNRGSSHFNRATNTATININEPNFLRPIIAHEANHHIQVAAQMEDGIRAMLLGDGTTGGILRSADGTLDRNFVEFEYAYNRGMMDMGLPQIPLDEVAIEYFNEATVDYLMGDLEGGKLQAQARRSKGEKAIRRIVEATIPKLPIIRDLFLRTGGAIDSRGRMVPGNGLLADGVREIPGARKMMRDAREEAMRRGRPTIPQAPPTPIEIINPVDQRPLVDSMFSLFETDPEGNVIVGAKGVPQVITKETERIRSTAGKDAMKVIDAELQAEVDAIDGRPVVDPEPIDPNDTISIEEEQSETLEQKSQRVKRKPNAGRGELAWSGTHFSPRALASATKNLNKPQRQMARMFNRSARDMAGDTFSVINHPALKTDEFGRKTYEPMGAAFREIVPVGMGMNKQGGVHVSLLSVTQLVENIRNRAASERGKRLYNGSELAIREDVEAVINLHRRSQKTDPYFAQKYGPRGPEYKNFINTVLALDVSAQRDANPLFAEDSINSKADRVFRTYRIDRMSKPVRLQGRTPLPFQYDSVKLNYLPLGTKE